MSISVMALNNLGQIHNHSFVTGTEYDLFLPPGSSGEWKIFVVDFTFKKREYIFDPSVGGSITLTQGAEKEFAVTINTIQEAIDYTVFNTYDEVFNYSAYYEWLHPNLSVVAKSNGNILFGNITLILDKNAPVLWDYQEVERILTLKCNSLSDGTVFKSLSITGPLQLANGALITGPYTGADGPSSKIVFNGVLDRRLVIKDSTGALFADEICATNTVTKYLPSGSKDTWTWYIGKYNNHIASSTFNPGVGGDFNVTSDNIADTKVTGTLTQTQNLSNLTDGFTNGSQIYDWNSLLSESPDFLQRGLLFEYLNGTFDFGSWNVKIDKNNSTLYSIDDANHQITIKANALSTNITTTGTVTTSNGSSILGIVSDSTGTTSFASISGLNNCSIQVKNGSGVIQSFHAGLTGTKTFSYDSTKTGTYKAVVTEFGKVYKEYSFQLGTGSAIDITHSNVLDVKVVNTNLQEVIDMIVHTNKNMYDYYSYWITTAVGINFVGRVGWTGDKLTAGDGNLAFDKNATETFSFVPATLSVTIKTESISGDITTNGVVSRLNGAKTTGVVTDSTGTTATVNFNGLSAGDLIYEIDPLGVKRTFATATGSTYTSYYLPVDIPAGNFRYSVKRKGYEPIVGTLDLSTGGIYNVACVFNVSKTANGSLMYGETTVDSELIVDFSGTNNRPRIKCGNKSFDIQNVFDTAERAMCTEDGMKWLALGGEQISFVKLAAGNFLFLPTLWRIMALNNTSYNAQIGGFAVTVDGVAVDGVNGPVSLLSASGAISDEVLSQINYIFNNINPIKASLSDITASVL